MIKFVFVKYLPPSSDDDLSQQSDSQVFRHLTSDELKVGLTKESFHYQKHIAEDRPVSQGKGSVKNTESGE